MLLARVTSVVHIDGLRMLTASMYVDKNPKTAIDISAELTAKGWQSLDLNVGDLMRLIIKSTSCIIYQNLAAKL